MSESYDEKILENIKYVERFSNEKQFREWFESYFKLLGFDAIIQSNDIGYPDFIMQRNGTEVRVELETLSSNFIKHRHDPKGVDIVFCLKKNIDLPVRVVEISKFKYTPQLRSVSVGLDSDLVKQAKFRKKNLSKLIREILQEQLQKQFLQEDRNKLKKDITARQKENEIRNQELQKCYQQLDSNRIKWLIPTFAPNRQRTQKSIGQKNQIDKNSGLIPYSGLIPCQLGKIWGHGKITCNAYCAIEHDCPITYLK